MSRFGVIGRGFAAAAVCLSAVALAAESPIARSDAWIRAEMKRERIPGLAVAIVSHGHVLLARGYGEANAEHRVPVTRDTVFQSGSVGKQFTAALVMLFVEDGKLSLEDSVSRYLPEAPPSWSAIRIRHLLTHTSGVGDYTTEGFDLRRAWTEDELVRMACAQPLEFPAGERWSYSNTGYLLLGAILDRVGGRHYSEAMRERVFAPLGMKSARLIDEASIVPHRAAGYRLLDGRLANQDWVAPELNTTADGSLYLSLNDMIAWDRALSAGKLLSAASWRAVYTPVRLNSGRSYPYGFGWDVDTVAGQTVYAHDGSWQGFETHISRYQGDALTIVVLANLAEASPERIARGIAGVMDPALAPPRLTPIEDREPERRAALLHLMELARSGALTVEDLPHRRGGFTPAVAVAYRQRFEPLGAPTSLELVARRELGDDEVSRYRAQFASGRHLIEFVTDADGRAVTVALDDDE
jgi:CubicO group peptidase (beta-lactamase class C family)